MGGTGGANGQMPFAELRPPSPRATIAVMRTMTSYTDDAWTDFRPGRVDEGALRRALRGGYGSGASSGRLADRFGRVGFHHAHSAIRRGQTRGGARARQAYVARPGAAETARDPTGAETESSFGTIGDSAADRDAFWTAVERRERTNGRIMQQEIFELPHELTPEQRRVLLRQFCEQQLGTRGLRWHAVVHKPDVQHGSDSRNFHAHIVFHDRPAEWVDGRWVFARTKLREVAGRSYPWGTETPAARQRRLEGRLAGELPAERRALFERQLTEVQAYRRSIAAEPPRGRGGDFVRSLRQVWAETCNRHLEQAGAVKRLTALSYADSGIEVPAQRHLGPAAWRAESRGIRTAAGQINRAIGTERAAILDEAAARADLAAARQARAEAERIDAGQRALAEAVRQGLAETAAQVAARAAFDPRPRRARRRYGPKSGR